jgi:hypothetical protein
MSFRHYLSWKHVLLVVGWPLLSFASNPVAFESVAEVAGIVVGGPLVILAGIYAYYAIRHKRAPDASGA